MRTQEFLDPLIVYVATQALCAAVLTAWTVRRPYHGSSTTDGHEVLQLLVVTLICTIVACVGGGNIGGALLAGAVATLCGPGLRIVLRRLTLAGALALTNLPLSFAAWGLWTWFFLRENEAPAWFMIFGLLANALAALLLGFAFLERLARQALLTHAVWRRPHRPLSDAGAGRPKVSIHLPCYAEPPEVVIATIDRLARLDYPDFEVMVCDNNTPDEALWRPVEAHCRAIDPAGDRFRFFHVAPLAGAKAGALNFCIEHMHPDATLVAVIDADYLSAPDFLSSLAGFFDDPQIGYVQTPHDYRDWQDSPYLRACYWEYMPNNKIELPGLNEYGAAFTIGTMCVIRADALRQAGGWAEWCLTEDSEVSVRLRALGYGGIYVRDTFGRGLVPETFQDYKKQRFRWTAGPVQQLRRHWPLFLPDRIGIPSALDSWSRLLEFQRGLAPPLQAVAWIVGLGFSVLFLGCAAAGASLPIITLPVAAWVALAIAAVTSLIGTWHRYRLSGCTTAREMLWGEVARLSLSYVQMLGGIAGLSAKPLAWRRTPKFKAQSSGRQALIDTAPETAIALGHVALMAAAIALSDKIGWSLALMMVIGAAVSAFRFIAAPIMALLSEKALSQERQSDVPHRAPLAMRPCPAVASVE